MFNNIQTWGLHHCVPHELVILFIYSFALYSLINPARRFCNLVKHLKKPIFNEGKQTLITTKYGIIWKNNKDIWNPHVMLSTMVYNLLLFEEDLTEKRPYKHKGIN